MPNLLFFCQWTTIRPTKQTTKYIWSRTKVILDVDFVQSVVKTNKKALTVWINRLVIKVNLASLQRRLNWSSVSVKATLYLEAFKTFQLAVFKTIFEVILNEDVVFV